MGSNEIIFPSFTPVNSNITGFADCSRLEKIGFEVIRITDPSSAPTILYESFISLRVSLLTVTPRRGKIVTNPSISNWMIASRKGVLLMPKCWLIALMFLDKI